MFCNKYWLICVVLHSVRQTYLYINLFLLIAQRLVKLSLTFTTLYITFTRLQITTLDNLYLLISILFILIGYVPNFWGLLIIIYANLFYVVFYIIYTILHFVINTLSNRGGIAKADYIHLVQYLTVYNKPFQ